MPKQPFVPVASVLRVKLTGQNQTAPWVNLFYVQYTGAPPSNSDLDLFSFGIAGTWGTTFGTFVHNQVSLLNVQTWDLTNPNAAIGRDVSTHTGSGPAGTPLPVNCAFVVSWPVQSRWRGGHFRTYIPGRNTADTTSGRTITGTVVAALKTQADAFRNAVNSTSVGTATCKLVGVRYFPTGVNVVRTSGTPFLISPSQVHTRLDSQRRRLGKELV